MVKGKPYASVHTRVEGDLGEVEVPVDTRQPAVIKKMEKAAGKEIKKNYKRLLNKLRQTKLTSLGLEKH